MPPPPRSPRGARSLAFVRRRLVGLLAVGLGCIVLGVVGGIIYGATTSGPPGVTAAIPEAAPELPAASRPLERRSFLARLVPPPAEPVSGPRVPRSIGDLARRLPIERKVAQLFLVGFPGVDQTSPIFSELRGRDLGGVAIESENYESLQQVASLAGGVATTARAANHVPPLVMTAQEGGPFSEIPDLPPAKAPGRIGSPGQAARSARQAGRSLKALGINGVFAPDVDVGAEGGGLAGTRVYSDDPDRVADFARETVKAYRSAGVLAAPKYFPGLGAATQPTEAGPSTVGLSLRELAQRDLRPFAAAVDVGVPAVVVGHGLYSSDDFSTPASLSPAISTGLLRRDLGFRGVAMTDDLASPAITGVASSVPAAAVDAVKAGADMVYISGPRGDQESAYVSVLNAARQGEIPRRRIDEAVLRILIAKRNLKLIR